MTIRFKTFLLLKESLNNEGIEDITHHEKVGKQMGSNPGGVYKNPKTGEKHYVKFYKNDQQSRSEVAASHVYHHMGVDTLKPKLVHHNGKVGVATKWSDDVDRVKPDYHNWSDHDKHQLAKHFVAGVVTKNWDAIGLEHDNILRHKSGKLINGDLGGAFRFRAQGGHKDFHDDIAEHESLRNKNYAAGHAFGTHVLTDNHIKKAVHELNPDHFAVKQHFEDHGVHDADEHAASVVRRMKKLKEKYK